MRFAAGPAKRANSCPQTRSWPSEGLIRGGRGKVREWRGW